MKKRFLSIVLAVLMLLSVLPVTAMAADGTTDTGAPGTQTAVGAVSADRAVHVNKSISDDGTTLTLEAYLTNKVIQTTSTKPLDIVLVLDQSGSMAYDFNGNTTNYNTARRQYAMKQAVNTFIGKVNKQYSDKGNHQMAIVTFGTEAERLIGWTAVNDSGKTQLTNAINSLPTQPEGATDIGLGMKKAQELMGSAQSGTDRQKIVIVFTDGVPTRPDQWGNATEFRTNVANEAISAAKAMKDAGTIVYTVGIFNGVNPAQLHGDAVVTRWYGSYRCTGAVGQIWGATEWGKNYAGNDFVSEEIPAGNRFLNYLSTNYKNATEIGIQSGSFKKTEVQGYKKGDHPTWLQEVQGFKITKNATRTATNYYLTARNADGLTGAFQTIIQENSTLEVKAGISTILSDTLSQYFTLNVPANTEAKNAITVEKWDCTGKDASGYTWKKATTQPNLNVEVTEEKTIKVTGFDYTRNAVTETVKEGNPTYSGSKLVVTIPIKPDTRYNDWKYGTKDYPTNNTDESKAGLSYGENGEHKLELDNSPLVSVTGYKVTYEFQGDVVPSNVSEPTDTGVYIAGQEATVKTVTKPVEGEYQGKKGTFAFGGWYHGDVKINTETIEINDNVTLTGTWSFTEKAKGKVTYVYEAASGTLPAEINTATGSYAVADGKQYYAGDKVKNLGPANGTTYTMPDNSGEWVLSWDKTEDTMTSGGVTFTGTWTFREYDKVTLSYEIRVLNPSEPQPSSTKLPDPQSDYPGNEVNVAGPATTTDNTRTWTFRGWYRDRECKNLVEGASIILNGNTTLYGYWTSETLTGKYVVTTYTQNADGTFETETSAQQDAPLGEMTYNAPEKTGYTIDRTRSKLTEEITKEGVAEFIVYYVRSSASKVTKVAKVNDSETPEADVGDTIDYYITVSNEGGLDLTNLTLTDTFNRADLHFDEGEGYTVTPVEGEEGKWTITIPSLTVEEHEITIHATYKVVDTDSGRTLRNTVVGTDDNTDGDSTVTVGEVTHNNVEIDIEKTVTSKRGTAPKEGYVFVAYYKDKVDGAEHELGRTTIYMSESATKDDPKTETGKIRFMLSDEEYKQLSTENDVPYLFVKELPGEDAFTEYDSTVLKGYVIPAPSANSIRSDEPRYNEVEYIVVPETNLFGSVFAFENIYKKPTSRVDPIKVGPQLNRDDHVAYIMGYPDGRVRPEGEITRAEACTIFFRLLTEESRDYYFSKVNDYTDVARGDWFNNAISTLSNAGIVTGYNDGTFRPNQPITRGEMAKIIANFANLSKGGKSFTDLRGHWSKTYVELAAGNGWIAGYPDGSFRPDQKITRAETVTMINRVLERVPAKESRLLSRSIMLTFPDNKPGDWYYIAIQEASNSHEYQRSVYETTGDEMWTKLIDNVDWTKLEK